MTALTQSIKRKLSLLQLAEELGNVAKAAKIMGFHRDSFYEVRRAFQAGGGFVRIISISCNTELDYRCLYLSREGKAMSSSLAL